MLEKRSVSGQPRKLLTPSCAHRRRSIERSDRMTAGRRRVRQSRPCFCRTRSSLSKERRVRSSRDSGTRARRRRGVCARAWKGHGSARAFAQECNAASPCPSASAGADLLIRFLAAGHTGVLIVEIDLTRIGPVSRTFPFGSDPARSAPPMVAARRTAHMTAAETTDRSRMEFALRMRLSACVAVSSDHQDRA